MKNHDEKENSKAAKIKPNKISSTEKPCLSEYLQNKNLSGESAQILHFKSKQTKYSKKNTKIRYANIVSYEQEYQYVLLSQQMEENNKVIWRIRDIPNDIVYVVETDEVMKRLDVLGRMHIKEATRIIFSAGMKCILREAEMKKKFDFGFVENK